MTFCRVYTGAAAPMDRKPFSRERRGALGSSQGPGGWVRWRLVRSFCSFTPQAQKPNRLWSHRRPADASVELDVDHIAYMLEHVGEDGVGLGSEADRRQRLPPV